jgi:hypothetical protein
MRGPPPSTSHQSVSPVETVRVVQRSGDRASPAPIPVRHPVAIAHRPLETVSGSAGVVHRSGAGSIAAPLPSNARPRPARPRVEIPQSKDSQTTEMKVATSAPVNPPTPGARGPRPPPNIAPEPSRRRQPRQERMSATSVLAKGAGATGGRPRASISRDTRDQ